MTLFNDLFGLGYGLLAQPVTDEQMQRQWAAQAQAMPDLGRTLLMQNLQLLANLPLTAEERDQVDALVKTVLRRTQPLTRPQE
jgi:hypothetical protein